MTFVAQSLLLDIEGTTSSISFVHDVMFPFVRRELETFLSENGDHDQVAAACEQIAQDAGYESVASWSDQQNATQAELVQREVLRLMDKDEKATGLKSLQGLIWKSGFESGELVAHVYDDVVPALDDWRANDIEIRIYSSGSIAAQKLFFGHTHQGDLLNRFAAHYDTTVGSKKESDSYERIANDVCCGCQFNFVRQRYC